MRAPRTAHITEIERFVEAHSGWIAQRRAELVAARPDFSDGAVVQLFGERFSVATGSRARIAGGKLYLPACEREKAFISFLKRLARDHMAKLVEAYAVRYGFSYTALRISSARGRWGSCSAAGHLSFSFRIALLSEEEARYIAVHELCHTRHMDHSAAFWTEVRAILPDYVLIRKGLRKKSMIMQYL